MTYDPKIHHRRSIRLQGYDYARAGAYFVTICARNRECLFGEIEEGEMRLNAAGKILQATWEALPEHYPHVALDSWTIMPNHSHGIIVLDSAGAGDVGVETVQAGAVGASEWCKGGFETRPYEIRPYRSHFHTRFRVEGMKFLPYPATDEAETALEALFRRAREGLQPRPAPPASEGKHHA